MNAKFWIGCISAALAYLLFASAVASAQTPPPSDDIVLSGFLTCSGTGSDRVCPTRLHYVTLHEGRTYLIRMSSTEFNASLMLEDLPGNLLGTDVDEFEALPGCILFRAPATAEYRLIATSAPPEGEGFYLLTIRELPVLMRVDAALTPEDALHADCFARSHEMTMIEGKRYIIDLESTEFEPFLKLMDPDGMIVAFNDECINGRPARVVFTAPQTGNYRLVATTIVPYATGSFRMMVVED